MKYPMINLPSKRDNHDETGDETEQLRTGLQEARAEIQALKATVTSLEAQVDEGKDCIRRVLPVFNRTG